MPRGEGTKKIGDLFLKYQQNLKAPQKHVIETFCDVVEDVVGVKIDSESVKYTAYSKTLSLTVRGPLKSEIMLRKGEIFLHLKGRLGPKNAPTEII